MTLNPSVQGVPKSLDDKEVKSLMNTLRKKM